MAAMSVLEPMCMLYRYTGDKRYLDFATTSRAPTTSRTGRRLSRRSSKRAASIRPADAKAYEMMSNLVGLVDLYRLTGDETFLRPALIAWKDIATRRLYVTGTTSSKEHFLDDLDLPGDEKAKVGEGCATVTWLQLNWQLLRITGEQQYADELERTVYNQLLGAQSLENGDICYFTPLEGEKKPTPGINCCVSSEPRGISMIPQLAWGTREGAPAVLLYVPGEVALPNVTLKSATRFPLNGSVTITVEPARPARFPIWLRVPAWCTRFQANGLAGNPGQYLKLERQWKRGDRIEIAMDLAVRPLAGGKSYPGSVAIQRGPQVLALEESLNKAEWKPVRQIRLVDASGQLPPTWLGKQAYALGGSLLVPFMDAKTYHVWLPAALE